MFLWTVDETGTFRETVPDSTTKAPQSGENDSEEKDPADEQGGNKGTVIMTIAGTGIVAAGGVGAALIVKKRKGKQMRGRPVFRAATVYR